MTSLLDTTHFHSALMNEPRRSNTPVCRNPAIVYAPSQVSSSFEDGRVVVKGHWEKGISGEDSCSPVSVTVTFDGDDVSINPVRTDNFSGIEEPVKLKPSMASGLIAALTEHFEELSGQLVATEQAISREPQTLSLSVGRSVHGLVDDRFAEPLAPCVVPSLETQVQLSPRVFAFQGR